MRKLMEVYAADNGLVLRNHKQVYHLFYTENKEDDQSFRITDSKEAFEFLARFFLEELGIDEKTVHVQNKFNRDVTYSFASLDKQIATEKRRPI